MFHSTVNIGKQQVSDPRVEAPAAARYPPIRSGHSSPGGLAVLLETPVAHGSETAHRRGGWGVNIDRLVDRAASARHWVARGDIVPPRRRDAPASTEGIECSCECSSSNWAPTGWRCWRWRFCSCWRPSRRSTPRRRADTTGSGIIDSGTGYSLRTGTVMLAATYVQVARSGAGVLRCAGRNGSRALPPALALSSGQRFSSRERCLFGTSTLITHDTDDVQCGVSADRRSSTRSRIGAAHFEGSRRRAPGADAPWCATPFVR